MERNLFDSARFLEPSRAGGPSPETQSADPIAATDEANASSGVIEVPAFTLRLFDQG